MEPGARKPVQLIAACLAAACVLWGALALDRISAESLRTNIAWLASDAAKYITGVALTIDAGTLVKTG